MMRGNDRATADAAELAALGRQPQLKRIFGKTAVTAFGSGIMLSWQVIALTASDSATVLGILVAVLCFLAVYISIASLASKFPTSGGQYEWVSHLSHEKWERFASYSVGWLNFLGWIGGITGISLLLTSVLEDIILLWHPGYPSTLWTSTLITIAIICASVGLNSYGARIVSAVEIIAFFIHIFGLMAVVIILFCYSFPRLAGSEAVLLGVPDDSGWGSKPVAWLNAWKLFFFAFIGFDSQVHIAEETKNPSQTLPRGILLAVGLNLLLALLMTVTIGLCFPPALPHVDARFNTSCMGVFEALTGPVWSTVMALCIAVALFCSVLACTTTANRQLWAFSRDDGVPYAAWLKKVHPTMQVPFNALLTAGFIPVALACINFGSTVALNAVLSMGTTAIVLSYGLCIGQLLWHRLSKQWEDPEHWKTGVSGLFFNVVAMCFLLVGFLFLQFPGHPKPSPKDFNWSPVMVLAVLAFATVWWWHRARKAYTSPRTRRMEAESSHHLEPLERMRGDPADKDVSASSVEAEGLP